MGISKIIVCIMAVFMALAGLDRIFGNRFGLGGRFEDGFHTMGELALTMIGIMVLSPVIADVLSPVVTPVFRFLGADPAVFAGSILACDMGGAPLARELAETKEAGQFGGLLVASTLGGTVSFLIPYALIALDKEDHSLAAKGMLWGVVTVPVGIFAGGLAAGFGLGMVLRNSVPVLILSALIALGLWKAERVMVRGFVILGKGITALATVGLVAAGVEDITGLVLIPGLASLYDAFVVVGQIAIVLAGAFPLLTVINRVMKKPFGWLGRRMGVNAATISGLMAALANPIAALEMVKHMDARGKVVTMAFAVSAICVFGDHLAFAAGFDAEMIPALIVTKLVGGVTAVALALLTTRKKAVANGEKA